MLQYLTYYYNSSHIIISKALFSTPIRLMPKPEPRCPRGKLARQVCVTEKCSASPFICQECTNLECEAAHRFCKTMKWNSAYQMLKNYRKSMPQHYVAFMGRIEKIYHNLQQKINRQIRLFREYMETEILSPQYMRIMHFLNVEQYDSISCKALSTVFQAITSKPPQVSSESAQKCTLNEMRVLDASIANFLSGFEDFYKKKFTSLQKQVKLCAKRQENTGNKIGLTRSQTISKISNEETNNHSPSSPQRKMSQSLLVSHKSKEIPSNVHNKNILLLNSHGQKNYQSVESNKNRSNSNGLLANSQIIQRPKRGLKADLDYPKHINSGCIKNATVINHLLGRKVKQYKLIYRGSENGFSVEDFYRKMGNVYYNRNHEEITTMVLVKTKYGKVLGGCTKIKWARDYIYDGEDEMDGDDQNIHKQVRHKEDVRGGTFLFSADLNERYQLQDPSKAIYCGKTSVGFGRKDLRIVNEGNKYNKNYVGFPDSFNNGNYLGIKKSSLMLTGSKDSCYFGITEWEAFQIQFKNS